MFEVTKSFPSSEKKNEKVQICQNAPTQHSLTNFQMNRLIIFMLVAIVIGISGVEESGFRRKRMLSDFCDNEGVQQDQMLYKLMDFASRIICRKF